MTEEVGVWIERCAAGRAYGCVIRQRAERVGAWYGGGFGPESLFEIGSIRKPFNCALAGILVERGELDLGLRAADVWPELIRLSRDPRDRDITVHQLLSGTSGWLTPDRPGAAFRYNNAAFTAAEQVVARLSKMPADRIAPEVERRFKVPLGATSWNVYHFPRVFTPENIENPGPKLAIDSTLEDLIRWGQLWRDQGGWQGRQLVPAAWVRRATSWVNPGLSGPPYGYNWFVNAGQKLWPGAPEDSFGHAGFGTFKPSERESRAYLWVCPSLGLVVAIVADVAVGFANDFLEVPNGLTAQWIARVVHAVRSA